MRPTGYLLTVAVYLAVALTTIAVLQGLGSMDPGFAPCLAAILASQTGAIIWYRQKPTSTLGTVKLGLAVVLAPTALAFTLILQVATGWFPHSEATIPVSTIGSFVCPFLFVGTIWKALTPR